MIDWLKKIISHSSSKAGLQIDLEGRQERKDDPCSEPIPWRPFVEIQNGPFVPPAAKSGGDKMKETSDGMVKAPNFLMVDLNPPSLETWRKIRNELLTWDSKHVLGSHWDCIVAYAKEYEEIPDKLQWHQFVVFFFENPSPTLKLDRRWDELKDYMVKEATDGRLDWVQFE